MWWVIIGILHACILTTNSMMHRKLPIQLTENGYEGLVIAISENVPQDHNLIIQIEKHFKAASLALFSATRRRAYFKEITILVPYTWEGMWNRSRGRLLFDTAHIRIDNPRPGINPPNNPYVQHFSPQCGIVDQYAYMHLTPEFILSPLTHLAWGPVEKTIVHEWAHLRWGIRDEYPIHSNQYFYYDKLSGMREAVRCSLKIIGTVQQRYLTHPCKTDPKTLLYDPASCIFKEDTIKTKASGSYMYKQYIPSITSFCDNKNDKTGNFHNIWAPNRHNNLCGHKSAWEIMRSHEDFRNGKNTPNAMVNEPTFEVVQQFGLIDRYIIVMDNSYTMQFYQRYQYLRSEVIRFIKRVPWGSMVGLIQFANGATILEPLATMHGIHSRDMMVSRLAKQALVSNIEATALGDAIRLGIQMLFGRYGTIVIVTDGTESNTRLETLLSELEARYITISSILYGPLADPVLAKLSDRTGGWSYSANFENPFSTSLADAFSSILGPRNYQIMSEKFALQGRRENIVSFYIDPGIGNKTIIVISWSRGGKNDVDARISNNQNSPVDKTISKVNNSIIFTLATAEPGNYKLEISNIETTERYVQVQISSNSLDVGNTTTESMPVEVEAFLSKNEYTYQKYKSTNAPDVPIIYASVTKNGLPVVGANVIAIIDSHAFEKRRTIILADSGSSSDVDKEDGVYSAYCQDFVKDGRYSVTVKVNNTITPSARVRLTNRFSSAPLATFNDTFYFEQQKADQYINLSNFTRVSSAGFIEAKNIPPYVETNDLYPPSRIVDLELIETSYGSRRITVHFTAVGDDLDRGTVEKYEIYMTSNITLFLGDLHGISPLQKQNLSAGNLSAPSKAGSTETFSIKIHPSELNLVFAIAVIAVDDSGKRSSTSNMVTARLIRVTSAAGDDETDIIAGSVSAVIVLLAGVIVTVYVYLRRRYGLHCPGGGTEEGGTGTGNDVTPPGPETYDNQIYDII